MTSAEFVAKFGANWSRFTGTAMYQGLLSVLDTEHPRRKVRTDGERLHGASVFLNENIGFDMAVTLIQGLVAIKEPQPEPPTTFEDTEIQ